MNPLRPVALRDLFWLMVVLGLAVGWWGDHRHLVGRYDELWEEQWDDITYKGSRSRQFQEHWARWEEKYMESERGL